MLVDRPICLLSGGPYDGMEITLTNPVPAMIVFHFGELPGPGCRIVVYESDHPIDGDGIETHHSYTLAKPVPVSDKRRPLALLTAEECMAVRREIVQTLEQSSGPLATAMAKIDRALTGRE